MKNILELLENTAEKLPDKTAFSDIYSEISFLNLELTAKSIGSNLNTEKKPVAIFIGRKIECLIAMMGVVYAGGFYVVLDTDAPASRLNAILNKLEPECIIIDDKDSEKALELDSKYHQIMYSNLCKSNVDELKLNSIRDRQIATDPLYVLFTSGSTGTPKGCVVNHQNVLSYSQWFTKTFNINENTIFGSQTPFYFSMSVSDIFATLRTGATFNVIPKSLFSFPIKLIEFMNERKINTIYWVPSALSIVANWKVLDYAMPEELNTILFAGEVMPVKQLNYWINKLPDAMFANLFGPTETTDICTYYVVDKTFENTETLPIGRPCDNCSIILVKDDGSEAKSLEEGEIYVTGPFVAPGYYNDPEKTASSFVQNPLNKSYPEIAYRTGDLAYKNENGELIYISRKDFQIKRMGYRIELGEIEAAGGACDKVSAICAFYSKADEKIVIMYEGRAKEPDVMEVIKSHVPVYMCPDIVIKIKSMPYNGNGKIDRKKLMEIYNEHN